MNLKRFPGSSLVAALGSGHVSHHVVIAKVVMDEAALYAEVGGLLLVECASGSSGVDVDSWLCICAAVWGGAGTATSARHQEDSCLTASLRQVSRTPPDCILSI